MPTIPHPPKLEVTTAFAGLLVASLFAIAPASAVEPAWPELQLEPVASGLDLPYDLTHAGDGSGRLFVALADGRVQIVDADGVRPEPFLDIRDRVDCCGERALTAIAFGPTYRDDGHFFVLYAAESTGGSRLSRFTVSSDPDRADPASEEVLLDIPQPSLAHNANDLAFGADGYLYVATGDGGERQDPCRRAQDPGQLLGKVLRLDVATVPYTVPSDNPFVGVTGARDEVWALGLRNPWRMALDRVSGELLIGDAGEARFEEVNVIGPSEGAVNFGWNLMEGEACFSTEEACESGLAFEPGLACGDPALRRPALSRCHAGVPGCVENECAIIGGFRYRGHRSPDFRGVYVFSDWCHGDIWGARDVDGAWQSRRLLETSFSPLSFGEGEDGDLYLLVAEDGQVLRLRDLNDGFADDFESGTLAAWSEVVGALP
ncbi:MAG: PQQ-dependent sugar dehydrogenase [Acidobacteriota bacterium]